MNAGPGNYFPDNPSSVAILITIFTIFSGKNKEFEQRKLAEIALNKEKDYLRAALGFIGDAVICTDIHIRITFMNKVAEDLTGRSQEEAQGEQIDKIFNIIHHTPEKKEKSGR